jgi:arylsulfatase A
MSAATHRPRRNVKTQVFHFERARLSLALLLAAANLLAEDARPNVVLILADDLGWADLGCYGNTFNETPHIDRLARQGLRFTQFYAGPVCSPTRANLQSGQDQARFGITQHIPGHRRPFARLIDPVVSSHLPLEVETFAECLQAAGFATGYFGKWHLGGQGYGPDQQGWQEVVETRGHAMPAEKTDGESRRTAEFLTDRAVKFITAHRDRPFLLQVSHHVVHIPLAATPQSLAKYEKKQPQLGYPSHAAYAGLLEELDQSVGEIVAAVDRLRLAERTLILFLSDNGGLEHEQSGRVVTSNRPLRGEKGTLYEGGIRVPAIGRWSNHVPAESVCTTPAITQDIYPTLLELAGATRKEDQPQDGLSLAKALAKPAYELPRDSLFWHLPHYHHSTPAGAIRRGDWKLIEFFETGQRQLYNLRTDIGESVNLAAAEPARAEEMHRALQAWRDQVGARMPKANPDFDAARAKELAKQK